MDNGGEYTSKKFGQYLKDWDLHLDSTPNAYRIAKRDSSRFEFSPFFLMYNCHPQMAIVHKIKSLKESVSPSSVTEHVIDKLIMLRGQYEKATNNIKKTQERQKYYDAQHDSQHASSIHNYIILL